MTIRQYIVEAPDAPGVVRVVCEQDGEVLWTSDAPADMPLSDRLNPDDPSSAVLEQNSA